MKSITHTHISTSICIQEELIVRKEEESESYNQFRGGANYPQLVLAGCLSFICHLGCASWVLNMNIFKYMVVIGREIVFF